MFLSNQKSNQNSAQTVKRPAYQNIPRPQNHFAFDGYDVSQVNLASTKQMEKLLNSVNKAWFEGPTSIIEIGPTKSYDPLDYGLFGCVVSADGFFTCRTSDYYKAIFVDRYLVKDYGHGGMIDRILKIYKPVSTSECKDRIMTGKYGRHFVCFRQGSLAKLKAEDIVDSIKSKLQLRPIGAPISDECNTLNYSYLLPLMEGYLFVRSDEEGAMLSLFSRKAFDPSIVRRTFGADECYSVQRGSRLETEATSSTTGEAFSQAIPPEILSRRLRSANQKVAQGGGL